MFYENKTNKKRFCFQMNEIKDLNKLEMCFYIRKSTLQFQKMSQN